MGKVWEDQPQRPGWRGDSHGGTLYHRTGPRDDDLAALLLRQKFYDLRPSFPLRYATLALLFVNISVGGTLSHFAAPPIVMVATRWDWGLPFMVTNFGWKAVLGILVANTIYYLRFRRELAELRPKPRKEKLDSTLSQAGSLSYTSSLSLGWFLVAHDPSCGSRLFVLPGIC